MSTKNVKMLTLAASAMVALGFVPAAEADDCEQSGSGAGSIDGGDGNWEAQGIWNCGTGINSSMSGSYAPGCEVGNECEIEEGANFDLDDASQVCTWSVDGEVRQGDSVAIHSSGKGASGPPTANGECGGQYDVWLVGADPCLALELLFEGCDVETPDEPPNKVELPEWL